MNSRDGYQVLDNSETDGGAGASLVIDANQGLSLTLYSRLIYFVLKQGELAQGDGSRLSAQVKRELKQKADKALQNDGIDGSVRVLKGNSGLGDELKKEDGVEGFVIGGAATFMDFTITWFRSLGQVLADVLQRNDNVSDGSQDNADSGYSHTMFNDGHPESGLTAVGQASLGVSLASPAIGLARAAYQVQHKKTLKSHAYFAKRAQLKEADVEENLDTRLATAMRYNTLSVYTSLKKRLRAESRRTALDDAIDAVDNFQEIGDKAKVNAAFAKLKAAKQKYDEAKNAADAEAAKNTTGLPMETTQAKVDLMSAEKSLDDAKAKAKKARGSNRFVRVAAMAYRAVTSSLSVLWDRLSTLSYIFWLAWMPFVMAFGLAAASGPMLPFVLIITFGVGAVLTGLKLLHINPLKSLFPESYERLFPKNEAEQKPDVSGAVKAEFDRLAHATKLLLYIDQESMGIAAELNVKVGDAPRHAYKNASIKSELRDRLLGSIHERRGRIAVAGFRRFLSGLLTLVFIGWLSSAVLGYFGFSMASDFIGGTPFGGIGGAIAGIFTSISAMSQMRKQQLAYEAKMNTVLQSPYLKTKETKEQAFQRLYEQVETRKQLVEKYLADNAHEIARPAHFDELDAASQKLFNDTVAKHAALRAYLAKIDVFNDRYFEKFEHQAGAFTVVKKVLNRVYEFLGASQTGAFTARFTLLKGGLLAGALGFTLLAGMWPFLIAAAVLMVVLGTVAVIDYQMRVNQEHRENFLNTLDARLYYLETKNKELFAVQRENTIFYDHANELEVMPEPVVESKKDHIDSLAPSVSQGVGSGRRPQDALFVSGAGDASVLHQLGVFSSLESSAKRVEDSSLSVAPRM